MLESLLLLAGHGTSSLLFQVVISLTYRKYIMWLLITNHYIMDMYMYYVDSTCTLLSMTLTTYNYNYCGCNVVSCSQPHPVQATGGSGIYTVHLWSRASSEGESS